MTQTYQLVRDIPILKEVDVLVAGGGPAGLGAALGAARQGARVFLLERYGFFGGVAAWGLGMPVNQMRPGGKPRGAVHEALIQRLLDYGEDAVRIVDHALVCNMEYLKVAAMDVLDAAEVEYWLHGRVVDVLRIGERAAGAVVATKQGLAVIRAQVLVDATGDADASFFAGAETLKGRGHEPGRGREPGREGGPDGFLSPMTLCLLFANIDSTQARALTRSGFLNSLLDQARGKYPDLPAKLNFELTPFPVENCAVLNHAGTKLRGVLDGSSIADMTEAERYSRRQALQVLAALREFGGPAFEQIQLAASGAQVGVRETRRVKGLYILEEADVMSGACFDDVVAWRSGMLDIGFTRYEPMRVHDVPYRALVPEQVDGLLVAGRCISASHVAASAGKSMGNCMATGHAAGAAAALCAARGCQPRELDVRLLQTALMNDGVDLQYPARINQN